jgi:hypothetical protein
MTARIMPLPRSLGVSADLAIVHAAGRPVKGKADRP